MQHIHPNLYAQQLETILTTFAPENILVVFFEGMMSAPLETSRKVRQFLGDSRAFKEPWGGVKMIGLDTLSVDDIPEALRLTKQAKKRLCGVFHDSNKALARLLNQETVPFQSCIPPNTTGGTAMLKVAGGTAMVNAEAQMRSNQIPRPHVYEHFKARY